VPSGALNARPQKLSDTCFISAQRPSGILRAGPI
jgi:hypothetical protein